MIRWRRLAGLVHGVSGRGSGIELIRPAFSAIERYQSRGTSHDAGSTGPSPGQVPWSRRSKVTDAEFSKAIVVKNAGESGPVSNRSHSSETSWSLRNIVDE
jgi:hypothetical protein